MFLFHGICQFISYFMVSHPYSTNTAWIIWIAISKVCIFLTFRVTFNHYPQGKVTLFSLKSFYFVTLFQEKEKCNDFLLYVRSYIDLWAMTLLILINYENQINSQFIVILLLDYVNARLLNITFWINETM